MNNPTLSQALSQLHSRINMKHEYPDAHSAVSTLYGVDSEALQAAYDDAGPFSASQCNEPLAAKVGSIKRGEYVKRKPDASTVWIRGEYCGKDGYLLTCADDMNRFMYVKKSTILFYGFTY